MKRILLGLFILLGASTAEAQSDLTISAHPCLPPNTGTNCYRLHQDTTLGNTRLTISGPVNAGGTQGGGYRVAYVFGHAPVTGGAITALGLPLLGSPAASHRGSMAVRMPFPGSIVGISLSSTEIVTAGGAHVEAVLYVNQAAGNVGVMHTPTTTGIRAILDSGASVPQYRVSSATVTNVHAQTFTTNDALGCNYSVASTFAPTRIGLVCTILVTH